MAENRIDLIREALRTVVIIFGDDVIRIDEVFQMAALLGIGHDRILNRALEAAVEQRDQQRIHRGVGDLFDRAIAIGRGKIQVKAGQDAIETKRLSVFAADLIIEDILNDCVERGACGHRLRRRRMDEIPEHLLEITGDVIKKQTDFCGQEALNDLPVERTVDDLGQRVSAVAKIGHDGCEHVGIGLVSRGAADRRDISAIGLQHDQIADCGGAKQPVPCDVVDGVERIVDRSHIQRADQRDVDGNRSIRQRAVDFVEQQRGLLRFGQGDLVDGVVIVAIYQRIIQIRRICRADTHRNRSEDQGDCQEYAEQFFRLFHVVKLPSSGPHEAIFSQDG